MQSKRYNQVRVVIITVLRSIAGVARSFLPVELQREFEAESLLHFVEIADCVDLHGNLGEITECKEAVNKSTQTQI